MVPAVPGLALLKLVSRTLLVLKGVNDVSPTAGMFRDHSVRSRHCGTGSSDMRYFSRFEDRAAGKLNEIYQMKVEAAIVRLRQCRYWREHCA